MTGAADDVIDVDSTTLAIAILFAILVGALLNAALGAVLGTPTPDWVNAVLFFGLLFGFYWARGRK